MGRAKMVFTAGRLIHKSIVGELRGVAFKLGIDIKIEKLGSSWTEVKYGVEVTGPDDKVIAFKNGVESYFRKIEIDEE